MAKKYKVILSVLLVVLIAVAGVVVGFGVDFLWFKFLAGSTGIYELLPGFLCGLIAAVVVSLISKAPSKEVTDLFELAKQPVD